MKNLFGQEKDYYKPVRVVTFIAAIMLNMKAMMIETKSYKSRNTFMKPDHAWKTS